MVNNDVKNSECIKRQKVTVFDYLKKICVPYQKSCIRFWEFLKNSTRKFFIPVNLPGLPEIISENELSLLNYTSLKFQEAGELQKHRLKHA